MKNFFRVLRLTVRYRWSLVGAMASALIVALLWGANIGGLYPIVQVIFQKQSLQTWIDSEIHDSQGRIAKWEADSAELRQHMAALPPDQQHEIAVKLAVIESQLATENDFLAHRQRWKPYIDRYLPND
ncbi:MAG TPA: hypothetical protein VG056_03780, partial [Pirellulales bacterium]|nr:hypothetical protein [Pirellulales bacterium]